MNFNLPHIPSRQQKPREAGLTMMMDKGLSTNETIEFIESAGAFTDLVKFGFGTSIITNKLQEKINLYKNADIRPYFGGTLFEAFIIRGMFDQFQQYVSQYGIETVEVSDGSMYIPHNQKLEYIYKLAKNFRVLSEVGSKQKGIEIPINEWVSQMKSELEAGSWKVIAESRESGTIGIYNSDGSANESLIKTLQVTIDPSSILWEAPDGKQQIYFIKSQGPEVNLGNIAPNIVIPLECLRLGLRGDTFFDYLPDNLKKGKSQFDHVKPAYLDFQI